MVEPGAGGPEWNHRESQISQFMRSPLPDHGESSNLDAFSDVDSANGNERDSNTLAQALLTMIKEMQREQREQRAQHESNNQLMREQTQSLREMVTSNQETMRVMQQSNQEQMREQREFFQQVASGQREFTTQLLEHHIRDLFQRELVRPLEAAVVAAVRQNTTQPTGGTSNNVPASNAPQPMDAEPQAANVTNQRVKWTPQEITVLKNFALQKWRSGFFGHHRKLIFGNDALWEGLLAELTGALNSDWRHNAKDTRLRALSETITERNEANE